MKKLLLLIATLTALTAKSQTSVYHPFPDSNIVWIEQTWFSDFSTFPPCVIFDDNDLYISGDTAIGIHTYHKLYANGYVHSGCPPPGFNYYNQYWGAFRQDNPNKKVYLYKNGMDTLAYDFNLNAGDTLPVTCLEYSSYNYVESVDSILIGSQYHKRFWLTSFGFPAVSNYAVLIEGIGTSLGAFAPMVPPFESGDDLYCVKINNQTVWTNPLFPGFQCNLLSAIENKKPGNKISIIPNPLHISSVLTVNDNFRNAELRIYNTFGQIEKKYFITGFQTTINRAGLAEGIYLYELSNRKGEIATGKFMIE